MTLSHYNLERCILKRVWRRGLAVMGLLVLVGLVGLRVRYGGGNPYPVLEVGPPVLAGTAMHMAVSFPEPIGNVTVNSEGRLFFTVHPESRPKQFKLLEWKAGQAQPFPSLADQARFKTPLGLCVDRFNRLWLIDHGNHGFSGAHLWGIDLTNNQIFLDFSFPPDIAPKGSFLQDLKASPDGKTLIIADVSFWRKQPGLVVFDTEKQTARRILNTHPAVMPQDYIIQNQIKTMTFFAGLVALKAGVDGLTITPDGAWLYFAAMNHEHLYRLPMSQLMAEKPEQYLEVVARKPLNDGLTSDVNGRVLITDVEHQAIFRWHPESKKMEMLIQDSRIRWADAMCFGPEGKLYLADSAIPEQMLQSKKHIKNEQPYFVWVIDYDGSGVPGQ